MAKLLAVAGTLVAGLGLAVQPPLNARLGEHVSALGAAFVSLAGSAAVVGILLVATGGTGRLAALGDVPPVYLTGALVGAVNVTVMLLAVPVLGAGGAVATAVTSQLLAAVLLDRAGVLGLEQAALTPARLAGVALLVAGTMLVTLR